MLNQHCYRRNMHCILHVLLFALASLGGCIKQSSQSQTDSLVVRNQKQVQNVAILISGLTDGENWRSNDWSNLEGDTSTQAIGLWARALQLHGFDNYLTIRGNFDSALQFAAGDLAKLDGRSHLLFVFEGHGQEDGKHCSGEEFLGFQSWVEALQKHLNPERKVGRISFVSGACESHHWIRKMRSDKTDGNGDQLPHEILLELAHSVFGLSFSNEKSGIATNVVSKSAEGRLLILPTHGMPAMAYRLISDIQVESSKLSLEELVRELEESDFNNEVIRGEQTKLGVREREEFVFPTFYYPPTIAKRPFISDAKSELKEVWENPTVLWKINVKWPRNHVFTWQGVKNERGVRIPECLAEFEKRQSEAIISATHNTFFGHSTYLLHRHIVVGGTQSEMQKLEVCHLRVDTPVALNEEEVSFGLDSLELVFLRSQVGLRRCIENAIATLPQLKKSHEEKKIRYLPEENPTDAHVRYVFDAPSLIELKKTECYDADAVNIRF